MSTIETDPLTDLLTALEDAGKSVLADQSGFPDSPLDPFFSPDAAFMKLASPANILRLLKAYREAMEALREIKGLRSTPIGDTGFSVGPASLLRRAQEIARNATRKAKAMEKLT